MRHLTSFVATAVLVAASACSSDSVTDNRTILGLDLKLTPATDTLFLGGPQGAKSTATVAASASAQSGPIALPGHVFESGDSSVVSVTTLRAADSVATVTARALGTTTVSVRVNQTRATTTIVVLPYLKTVTVSAAPTQVLAGDTITLTAKAFGWAGDSLPDQAITFSSSSPAATVTATTITPAGTTGKVVFTAAGATTITAKSGDATATVALTALKREFIGGGANALASGMDATCGLMPLGRAFCFGRAPMTGIARDSLCFGLQGSPGDPVGCTLVPLPIAAAVQLTALAVGDSVACGLTASGQAWCWGDQKYGQVGNGIAKAGTPTLPVRVTGPLTDAAVFTQISAGHTHACGLISTGAAFCWGRDVLFQIGGNGDNISVNSSTPTPAGNGIAFRSISAGFAHTCGLTAAGATYCWGDNRRGQLGRGAISSPSDTALAVLGPSFTQISASGNTTCGLTSASTIYCWGANSFGQTGQTPSDSTPVPSLIGGSGFSYVATGGDHVCAMTTTGAVSCWGSNGYGQLAQGGIAGGFSTTPVGILGGRVYTSLSSGTHTSCAIAADGAYCWGSSLYGATGSQVQAIAVTTPQKTAPPQ